MTLKRCHFSFPDAYSLRIIFLPSFCTVADVLELLCSLYLLCPINVDVAVSLTDTLFLTRCVNVVDEYCESNIVASIV